MIESASPRAEAAPPVARAGPTRILHVLAAGTAGGCEHHVLRLLTRLDRGRWEPWLAVLEAQPDEARSVLGDFRAAGVRVVALVEKGRWSPTAFLRYGRLLRQGRFALVHSHALRADLLTLVWAWTLRPRPKLVRTIHNTDPLFEQPLTGRLARLSAQTLDATIVISEAVERYVRQTIGSPPRGLPRISYGLDPTALPLPMPPSNGRRVLLVPARLDPQKGQDVLIRALPTLRERFPTVEAWLAGHETGSSAAALRSLAADLGVAEAVRLLGFRDDVAALLRQAEIVVLPSRWEGFGLALLEAMNAARPVVASAVGAIPEVVVHGETGLLVPPDDPRALAEALAALLEDPGRAAALGRAGRRRLEARFGEQTMIQATEAVYNALLSAPQPARFGE